MTLRKLASEIAKREGKKHQASIGDIREILKIIAEIEAEECIAIGDGESGPLQALLEASMKAFNKKKKAKARK